MLQFLLLKLKSLHFLWSLKVSLLLHCWIFHCCVWTSRSDRLPYFLILVLTSMNRLNAFPGYCHLHGNSLLHLGECHNSPKNVLLLFPNFLWLFIVVMQLRWVLLTLSILLLVHTTQIYLPRLGCAWFLMRISPVTCLSFLLGFSLRTR